jgi:hypothetical protein
MKYCSVIIIGMIFFSCKKETTEQTEKATAVTNEFSVNLGSCISATNVANTNFKICYDSLISESRCPSDVVCVWAGVALVKLSFMQNNITVPFKLSTLGGSYFSPKDTTINGVNIKLVNVLPYPKFNGANNEVKKVTLLVQ